MSPTHRTAITLTEDGKVVLEALPFRAGEQVEVVVRSVAAAEASGQSLLGTVLAYDHPTAPIADDDWSASR